MKKSEIMKEEIRAIPPIVPIRIGKDSPSLIF